MIDFEELFLRRAKRLDEFSRKYSVPRGELNRLIEDYKKYLELSVNSARKIANALGVSFGWMVYRVECEIIRDCFNELKSRWDDELQEKFLPYVPLEDNYGTIYLNSWMFRPYLGNMDMARVLIMTCHIYAKQLDKRPEGPDEAGEYFLTAIHKSTKEIQKEVEEIKEYPDRFYRWLDLICEEAEYKLNIDDMLVFTFYHINTLI